MHDCSHPQSFGKVRMSIAMFLALGSNPGLAPAQTNYGVADLPMDLAAAGTVVEGVVNKSPTTGGLLGWCDGPVYGKDGTIYFSINEDGGWMWKIPPGGKPGKFAKEMYQGTEFDAQDRLLASGVTAGLRRFNPDGTFTALETFKVKDMSQGTSGAMFLCDHATMVYFRSAAGVVTKITGNNTVTGVKWIEEKKLLYIAAPGDGKIWRFNATDDGVLTNRTAFASLPHSDGLEVDENYNVYITNWGDGAIDVRDPDGKLLGRIPVKSPHTPNGSSNVTNVCWGGADNKSLYITGDGGLYKVQLKVAGRKLPGASTAIRSMRMHPAAGAQSPVQAYLWNGSDLPGMALKGFASTNAKTLDGRLHSPARLGTGIYVATAGNNLAVPEASK